MVQKLLENGEVFSNQVATKDAQPTERIKEMSRMRSRLFHDAAFISYKALFFPKGKLVPMYELGIKSRKEA